MTGTLLRISRLWVRPATILWFFLLAFVTCLGVSHSSSAMAGGPPPSSTASPTESGAVNLPHGFRRWEHVGTRVETSGRSMLDGSVISTPQMMDTYVEPSAFIEYKKSGKWPDGTQIVKELSLIKTGGNCGKNTLACSTPVGAGIFEDSFIGIGMMVKDRRRYPTAPGNWAYFRFFAHNSAYMATSSVLAPNQCQSCHVKFASKEDDVFTDI